MNGHANVVELLHSKGASLGTGGKELVAGCGAQNKSEVAEVLRKIEMRRGNRQRGAIPLMEDKPLLDLLLGDLSGQETHSELLGRSP